jgi:hypothetical protein
MKYSYFLPLLIQFCHLFVVLLPPVRCSLSGLSTSGVGVEISGDKARWRDRSML